ncbi:glycosyltransferase [Pseudomonas sp. TH31]|uniref:glycosyltransferase n=1 Tax=Pseudomonas sp. TH31 TaxID=2796396 RepID=UPI001F5B144B|nr:glycosyltransferase [Pseudomonas sp. TH31]
MRKNTYDFSGQGTYTNIKESLDIRDSDILIARTTRIIPQKRQDRDIHLIHKLNTLFAQNGSGRKVYLAVAGDPDEHPAYFEVLNRLARELQVEPFIKFIGSLSHDYMPSKEKSMTIEDLYYSCDLVSFLTSWGYDSYGNPVGEAISSQRCYITTRYEYYLEVYGQYGFEAPIMQISPEQDGLPDDAFIDDVYQLLNNKTLMGEVAHRNFSIGQRVLSNNVMSMLDLSS